MTLVNQIFKYFPFLFILLFYSSCTSNHNEIVINGYTMGTTYSITIANFKEQEDSFKNQIDSLLSIVNKHFSTYLNDSEISNINTQFDPLAYTVKLGHALGLEHQFIIVGAPPSNSIMQPFLDPKSLNADRFVTQDDVEAVIVLYGQDGFGGWNNPIKEHFIIIP